MSSTSARLRQSANVIKGWLHRCNTEHAGSSCARRSSEDIKPLRLISIDPSRNTARLVDTPSPLPPYVALSYVWGDPEGNMQTTRRNLSEMQASINLDLLPLTLRHVFELVGYLDIQYLWIDALCIVQDDQQEKSTEISHMSFTFYNARLQIAAMASKGASYGLLPPERDFDSPEEHDQHHVIMKACRSLRQKEWDGKLRSEYPLLKRAWTFQERILARSCVHFTAFELLWECKQARWCECGGIEAASTNHGSGGSTWPLTNNFNAAFDACANQYRDENAARREARLHQVIPLWRECVMSYSKRDLTYPEDRLAAISGIAQMLRGPRGKELYLAGLWRDALPFDLLWRCDQSAKLAPSKRPGPSWSWASVDCGVHWPAVGSSFKGASETPSSEPALSQSLEYIASTMYFERGLVGVSVEKAEVHPPGSSFGSPDGGTVVLSGRITPVRVRKHPNVSEWEQSHETEWSVEGIEDGDMLPFYPDTKLADGVSTSTSHNGIDYYESSDGYTYVEIATLEAEDTMWEAGLVLKQCSNLAATYERVGMAGYATREPRTSRKWWLGNPLPSRVIIV
ncbi:heterokaryon incompatibility protein-domain-containing protein [Xylariales sp. PMI_506]|nr:heterokaryon incompatibility protein-domain-containing protein [Xylariales sp. PMI_506]